MTATLHKTEVKTCEVHGEYESKPIVVMDRLLHMTCCPKCADESRARQGQERLEREASEKQARLDARIGNSGIPTRFRSRTFENFIADTDGKEKAVSVAMQFANEFKRHHADGTTVVFSGLPGTGKTHLASAIGNEILKTGTVIYTSAIDAVRSIRDTWRRDSVRSEIDVLADFTGVDLLILDEVGVQFGTEAEQVHLFDIIDKRYREMMPTILLTNLGAKGMKEFLGDRSFDRLRECGIWVKFDWESHRGRKPA